jgi:hypothetical protein
VNHPRNHQKLQQGMKHQLMPKDTLMTPSNPNLILHPSLHLNFTKTLLLVNSMPSNYTNLHNRSPSRLENFIIKVLALKMELISSSPIVKQDKAPKNV